MARELRKIILDRDELAMALECYKRLNLSFLPAGKVAGCQIKPDHSVTVHMEVPSGTTIQKAAFALKQADLLEPVIKFCIENNIPLPRKATKSILLGEDYVTLYMEMEAEYPDFAEPGLLRL